jgi:hypothetical protein
MLQTLCMWFDAGKACKRCWRKALSPSTARTTSNFRSRKLLSAHLLRALTSLSPEHSGTCSSARMPICRIKRLCRRWRRTSRTAPESSSNFRPVVRRLALDGDLRSSATPTALLSDTRRALSLRASPNARASTSMRPSLLPPNGPLCASSLPLPLSRIGSSNPLTSPTHISMASSRTPRCTCGSLRALRRKTTSGSLVC